MTLFDITPSPASRKGGAEKKSPTRVKQPAVESPAETGLRVLLQFDGGSRGNPGPAGVGITLSNADSGATLYELGESIGVCTNNVAEYTALLRGLTAALAIGASQLIVRSDSELVVRQLNGIYKVKSPDLKPLFQKARALIDALGNVKVSHVMREGNTRADTLANLAMDRAASGGGGTIEPLGPPVAIAKRG